MNYPIVRRKGNWIGVRYDERTLLITHVGGKVQCRAKIEMAGQSFEIGPDREEWIDISSLRLRMERGRAALEDGQLSDAGDDTTVHVPSFGFRVQGG